MRIGRLWQGVAATVNRETERLLSCAEYRAVVWWLPLGVIIFFAIFFSQEVVGTLPIAVVDEDHSSLSRKLISMIRATPQVSLVKEVDDVATAYTELLQGEVVGVVEIPDSFADKVLSGESADVIFYDSGTNISTNALSSKGVQTAVTTFGMGVSLQRAEMRGMLPDEALVQAMPIAFTSYGLFNPWLNYAYYVAPCFWAMVLIIAAMLSTIYSVGVELRYATSVEWLRGANGSLVVALIGKLAPITLLQWLLAMVVGAIMFGVFEMPMRGTWTMLAMGTMSLIVAYQAVALSIVALTASFRLSLSLGGGYSVLAFTFSGVTFPTIAMLPVVQPFTMLFPYTYFMELYIDQAVRGSAWWWSLREIAAMLLFCILPLLLFGRLKRVLIRRKYWGRL